MIFLGQVRILMAKKPDRRSVEEIEFVIHYLDRFDYWTKISDIKNHDDDAKKYAATGHNKRNGSGGGGSALSGLTSRLQRQIVRHLSTLMYTKKEVGTSKVR